MGSLGWPDALDIISIHAYERKQRDSYSCHYMCMYTCVYMYVYTCVSIYMYIYIYMYILVAQLAELYARHESAVKKGRWINGRVERNGRSIACKCLERGGGGELSVFGK